MTEIPRPEGRKGRLIAEWDPDTNEMTRCEFVDPVDDGTEVASEDRTTEHVEPTIDALPYPLVESRGDQLRRLGGAGMEGAHVWGD